MGVIRLNDRQISRARCARLISDETVALAVGLASGGFELIVAPIEDPIDQFRLIAEVKDAESLFNAVGVISKK